MQTSHATNQKQTENSIRSAYRVNAQQHKIKNTLDLTKSSADKPEEKTTPARLVISL
jgi:hypothetical protein